MRIAHLLFHGVSSSSHPATFRLRLNDSPRGAIAITAEPTDPSYPTDSSQLTAQGCELHVSVSTSGGHGAPGRTEL